MVSTVKLSVKGWSITGLYIKFLLKVKIERVKIEFVIFLKYYEFKNKFILYYIL